MVATLSCYTAKRLSAWVTVISLFFQKTLVFDALTTCARIISLPLNRLGRALYGAALFCCTARKLTVGFVYDIKFVCPKSRWFSIPSRFAILIFSVPLVPSSRAFIDW